MTINLISKEEFDIINNIQKNVPTLTFQNNGYEYLKGHLKRDFNDNEKKNHKIVSDILSKNIVGFSSFNHFKISAKKGKEKELVLRLQYRYDADLNINAKKERIGNKQETGFIGVGYITLRELHKGFD